MEYSFKVYKFCLLICILHSWTVMVATKQPHILLVVADDYGWNDIGYHGSEIKTPTLDKLASEGVKLENYYVQPICTPTRSQLMSGRYQVHTGLQHGVIHPLVPNGLPLDIPTMADKLGQLGYSTNIVGKWHLGFYKKEYLPTNRGFHSFFGYLTGAEDYFEHNRCDTYKDPDTKKWHRGCGLDFHNNLTPVTNLNGSYSAEVFANRVEDIVRVHSQKDINKPVFVYMPFQSVHSPLEVPEKYTEQYSFIKNETRRIYAGMVSAMDEAVNNITEAFKNAGLWNDTIMIFSTDAMDVGFSRGVSKVVQDPFMFALDYSDNGGQVHAGGNNYPLKGWKASLWEGGVRGVGFVHGNMLNKKGIQNNELVHVSDWFPTLVTLAGGNTTGLQLDGYNVWNAISNGEKSPRYELLHNIDPLATLRGEPLYRDTFDTRFRAAIRYGDWKLLTGDPGVDEAIHVKPPGDQSTKGILEQFSFNNKKCYDPYDDISPNNNCKDETLYFKPERTNKKNVWLYNIKSDPYEYNDLSDKNPDIVRKLLDRLAYYNSTAIPCRYPPKDPNGDPQKHGGVWGPWE